MEAYSNKVRELVLDAYDQGTSTQEIAEDLNVSPSWARRVKQRLRELGLRSSIKQKHGPDPKFGATHRQELVDLVKQTPDATLAELQKKLSICVSISTIARTLTDIRLTLKKSRSTPASRSVRT
jgi:transposase